MSWTCSSSMVRLCTMRPRLWIDSVTGWPADASSCDGRNDRSCASTVSATALSLDPGPPLGAWLAAELPTGASLEAGLEAIEALGDGCAVAATGLADGLTLG